MEVWQDMQHVFSNVGYYSQYIDDPFYPAPTDQFEKCLLIAFSNSGETKEVIDQLRLYRGVQSKIISITNDSNSTIAKMSDLTIPYFIKKLFYQILKIFHLKYLLFILLNVFVENYKLKRT